MVFASKRCNDLRNDDFSTVSEKISYFKDIWPALGIYLDSSLPSRSESVPDITQNFELLLRSIGISQPNS